MDRNPSLVQRAPQSKNAATPLFLIHDGGGTTFAYHCLPSLQRTVYAIHNPRFYSGRPWAGGLPAMAKVYANLIRTVVPSGKILLGGWSLGGLLALEIASVLSQASALTVVGIVTIDSIFPGALKRRQEDVVSHPLIMSTFCKPEIRMLVASMMKTSAKMVEQWIMPSWSSRPTLRRRWNSPLPGSNGSTDGEFMSDNEDNGDFSLTIPPTFGDSVPPPTVLLRCQEFVPVPSCGRENAISRVDVAREKDFLGWEEYEYHIIYAVLQLPGHHFNVFSEHHIKQTAMKMIEASEILERLDGIASHWSGALQPDLF